jgi:hypothetical protein
MWGKGLVLDVSRRDVLLIVGLAVVEVVVTETVIRLGLVGIERASTVLFILLLLNFALVTGLHAQRRR